MDPYLEALNELDDIRAEAKAEALALERKRDRERSYASGHDTGRREERAILVAPTQHAVRVGIEHAFVRYFAESNEFELLKKHFRHLESQVRDQLRSMALTPHKTYDIRENKHATQFRLYIPPICIQLWLMAPSPEARFPR